MANTSVGERIRDRRIELNMTQDELAKKAGYKSRSSINKIELARDLPLKKVEVIANALECSPSYLMGWGDNPVYKAVNKLNSDKVNEDIKQHIRLNSVSPTTHELDIIIAFRNADYRTQRSVLMALGLDEQEEELRAAHERTDIETNSEMKQHDYDIMKGDDF